MRLRGFLTGALYGGLVILGALGVGLAADAIFRAIKCGQQGAEVCAELAGEENNR